jgi:Mn-containing catalase
MFKYEAENIEYVNEIQENPECAILLQEKLSPINMCLKNSVQYMTQAFRIEDADLSGLLLKLSGEELNNYELFSRVIKVLSGEKVNQILTKIQPSENIVVTGELCTDLLSDIALEEQSKLIFGSAYELVEEPQLKEFLMLLIAQAEEHSVVLREAFNKIQRSKIKAEFKTSKTPRMCFGTIKPVLNENSYEEFKKTAPAVLGGRD